MRNLPDDLAAPKQTVSLTLNSDLYTKAKSVGINASRVAEQALSNEYAVKRSEQLQEQLKAEWAFMEKFERENGSFVDSVWPYTAPDDESI